MSNSTGVWRAGGALPRLALLLAALACAAPAAARAQGGAHTLFGDVKVEEEGVERKGALLDVILYTLDGRVSSRQRVAAGGRYRFVNLRGGEYDIVVEVENTEVARIRVLLGAAGPAPDFRQDIELAWKGGTPPRPRNATVSAADFYERPAASRPTFEKAQAALDRKDYAQAVTLLRQVTDADPKDFQAWTEMGTAHLLAGKKDEAERAYLRAVEERPTFFLAQLNLGRLRHSQKKYEEAVEPLTRAVKAQPASAEANFLLGEAYLQLKKGSKAVPHLNEAARRGEADAHIRLATLYNAVGRKDLAAVEYEQFLAKQPNHPDRKKLEQYVKENKKQ